MITPRPRTALPGILLALAAIFALGQGACHRKTRRTVEALAVELTASIAPSGAGIVVRWNRGPEDTRAIDVYRRSSRDAAFGPPIAPDLPPSTTSYTDSDVIHGVVYEYYVERRLPDKPWRSAAAISAAIDAPLLDDRGEIALVIEESVAAPLAAEIDRLEDDLAGDGWTVARIGAKGEEDPPSLKAKLKALYDAAPERMKAALLLGHLPVPYAGNAAPDWHMSAVGGYSVHLGAWPADVYYADMVGRWTDSAVDTRTNADQPSDPRNVNIPGDGKFDQQWAGGVTPVPNPSGWPWPSNQNIPGDGGPDPARPDGDDGAPYQFGSMWLAPARRAPIAFAVGRVDLHDMPAFAPLTEIDLLRRYLDKDHGYRHKLLLATPRGLIRDAVGFRPLEKQRLPGTFPAAGALSSFGSLLGPANVHASGWFEPGVQVTSQFAFASCAGQQTSCRDVCSTADLVAKDPRVIFTLLYGSHFGDWDHRDNLLRAVIAAPGSGLAAGFGDPSWFFEPMGVGGTVGDALLLTQRAVPVIHLALMGDPTLRLHVVAPPSALEVSALPVGVKLTWRASPDPVIGYHVYRSEGPKRPWKRLSSEPVRGTELVLSAPPAGARYMVRALALQRTPTGSYFNASQGIFADAPAR